MDINFEDEWISEFNEEERKYGKFYKDSNASISLQFIYVNSKREIIHVSQSTHKLDKENVLTSSSLNNIVFERNQLSSTCYRLYKLLLYNIETDPEDIINDALTTTQLREINEIADITIMDTVSYLQPINTLIFIFVEDVSVNVSIPVSLNKGTRRIKRNV
jgi:hypothetical protein